jgi:hypothetical protein
MKQRRSRFCASGPLNCQAKYITCENVSLTIRGFSGYNLFLIGRQIMLGKNDITCPACFRRQKLAREKRLARHLERKAYFAAKRDAIISGKVIVLTCRDDITGLFYRYDKNSGNLITLGRGTNRGA